jgi:hypothetical protein
MARIARQKRWVGTALKRTSPSRAAVLLVSRGLVRGRTLDYGCGFGLDADTFGWDADDANYGRPRHSTRKAVICSSDGA